jgi:hypothetical protein
MGRHGLLLRTRHIASPRDDVQAYAPRSRQFSRLAFRLERTRREPLDYEVCGLGLSNVA